MDNKLNKVKIAIYPIRHNCVLAAQDTLMRSEVHRIRAQIQMKISQIHGKNLRGLSKIVSIQLLTYYLTIMTKKYLK